MRVGRVVARAGVDSVIQHHRDVRTGFFEYPEQPRAPPGVPPEESQGRSANWLWKHVFTSSSSREASRRIVRASGHPIRAGRVPKSATGSESPTGNPLGDASG